MVLSIRRRISAAVAIVAMWAAAAEAGEIVRMGVMCFVSKADGVSQKQAEIVTDIFTRTLTNSKTIAVIERERLDAIGREQKLSMSGLVDPGMAVDIGRLAGCSYMILGAVTELSEGASGFGFSIIAQAQHTATATIDMRVVDVNTGEIVLSLAESGTSDESATAVKVGGFVGAEASFGGLKARAIASAAARLGHKIKEEFGEEYSHVVSVNGKTVNISQGATSGVGQGDLWLIYADGPEMHDMDGVSLGREQIEIAVVKVRDVRSGFSVCEVTSGGGKAELIRRGDKVEPVSKQRAGELAKRKAFVSERPRRRAYDDTADMLFGKTPAAGGDTAITTSSASSSSAASEPSSPEITEEPAAEEQPTTAPVASVAPSSRSASFENDSTEPSKVIPTYGLPSGEANMRIIAHNGLRSKRGKAAYEKYVELAESFDGDYLAAYRAGVLAQQMKEKDQAAEWFRRALAINPDYKPALKALGK